MEKLTEKKLMARLINNKKIEIERKLKKIFRQFKGKKFNLNKNKITDYFDSLEMMNLISGIEKKFKIKLDPNKINERNFFSLRTINDLIYEKVKFKK